MILCFGRSEAKSSIHHRIMTTWEIYNNNTKVKDYFKVQKSVRMRSNRGKCRKDVFFPG